LLSPSLNQWQLGHVALGCDWLGYMPHLKVLRSHDDYPYAQATPAQRAEKHSRFDKLASHGTPEFLRLYVGVAF
jgi:hypothetical protein